MAFYKNRTMRAIITLLLLAFTVTYATAQTPAVKTTTNSIRPLDVPEVVKNTFKNEFPRLQPKWEADNKNYKAIYSDPKTNSKGIITYDPNGNVINRDVETNVSPEKEKE
jgi:hypothetical protein